MKKGVQKKRESMLIAGIFLMAVLGVRGDPSIPPLTGKCSTSTYFNHAYGKCLQCGENQISVDSWKMCQCKPDFVADGNPKLNTIAHKCVECSGTDINNADFTACVANPGGVDPTTCSTGIRYYDIDGTLNPTCLACGDQTQAASLPFNAGAFCAPCQASNTPILGQNCKCPSTDDFLPPNYCVPKTEYPLAAGTYQLAYEFSTDGSFAIQSQFFKCNLRKVPSTPNKQAGLLCQKGDTKSCSLLANLCALSLYNSNNEACKKFRDLMKASVAFSSDYE
jgi:hypothetical protein